MKKIILASASPRRQELLKTIGVPFQIEVANIAENINDLATPKQIVAEIALKKAEDISQKHPGNIVIGADTIVYAAGKVIGKPKDSDEAESTLASLSGKIHQVYTGVAVVEGEKVEVFVERTDVEFWPLTSNEIKAYLATGEPFDKAGGYGIQGQGKLFVKRINGDYYSVVGLPVARLARVLKEFGG